MCSWLVIINRTQIIQVYLQIVFHVQWKAVSHNFAYANFQKMRFNQRMIELAVMEKKIFEVRFEGSHGGRWFSITKRSGGFTVSLGFEREEMVSFLE